MKSFRRLIWLHLVVTYEFFSILLFLLPRYPIFNYFKAIFLKCFGAKIGRRPTFYSGVFITTGRNLTVGDDVDFAAGVKITTDGGLSIGNRVLIGYSSHILTKNHVVPPLPGKVFSAGHSAKAVSIGDDCWIGAGCLILPGVSIGKNCIVAAGSVVTKSVADNSIIGGVPARLIKMRE